MSMGFCYGGPYASLGPARLGYDAGILHGYMMRAHKNVFDAKSRDFSMARAHAILEGLRGPA